MEESSKFCRHCGRQRLVRRRPVGFLEGGWFLLFSLLSCGLLLPVFVAVHLGFGRPWRCSVCGSKC